MRKMLVFAERNGKEIVRDPISVAFGLGFPVVLLLLLSLINRSIPAEAGMRLFEIDTLAPGVAVFGLSFLSLFSAMLISKDRCSAFVTRLYISPMRGRDYIFGYLLPLIPIAVAQLAVCFLTAVPLGLTPRWNIALCILLDLPIIMVYISIGLLCGTFLSDKAVGGICGALLTNLSAWLSGTWFSLDLVGGAFKTVAYLLPFANAVDAGRLVLAGDYAAALPYLGVVSAWAVGLTALSVFLFAKKRKE